MTTFTDRLARSRAMYEAGEDAARCAIAHDRTLDLQCTFTAYPRHEAASFLLGAAHALRACVPMRGGWTYPNRPAPVPRQAVA